MIAGLCLSFLSGILVDRFGAKKILGFAMVVSALGACLRLVTGSYIPMLIFMVMTGFGAAVQNANSAKIIGNWFPPEKVRTAVGIHHALATFGNTVALSTTSLFPSAQSAFMASAVLSVVVVLLFITLFRNSSESDTDMVKKPPQPVLQSLKAVIGNKTIWVTGLCLMLNMSCILSINTFLPTALKSRGIDAVTAGVMTSLVSIGNLLGNLFGPFISSRIGKMKPYLLIFGVLSALGAAFSWLAPAGILLTLCLLLTGFSLGSGYPILMSIPVQLKEIDPRYGGTAGGFAANIQLVGPVLIPANIIAPIAGSNYYVYYILTGCLGVIYCVLVRFFLNPNFRKQY